MTTIGTTKEAAAAAKTRMEKAVDDFRKELATQRGTVRRGRGGFPRTLLELIQEGNVALLRAVRRFDPDRSGRRRGRGRGVESDGETLTSHGERPVT